MKAYRLAALAAFGMLAAGGAAAGEDKWGAHIDLEGKLGTDRHLGETDLFLPLAQDGTSLLFANLRTRMDDQSSREGNFGLGLRHMLDSGWNLGGYGYFDRRRSEYHNYFNQMTLGAEALSLDWDVRANGYVPVGRHGYDVDSLSTAEMAGASVIFRGGEENSLGGFDAEIGWRVPLFAADAGQQFRVYGGGYRFADEGIPMVAGPRGRAEMVFDEVPGLWDGSRLSLGAELQNDDPRGTQGFLSARLRIPLQAEASRPKLTPMERRMTDPIVRDIDVVAQAGAYGAAEVATASNGGTLTVISSATTSDVAAAIAGAGANSTVILSGSFTNNDNTITLNSGQTVMGTGNLTVRSPSGRTATLTRSTGATVTGTYTVNGGIVEMANNSTLTGVTLSQVGSGGMVPFGVYVNGSTGVTIANNTISVSHDQAAVYGIYLDTGSSATIRGNSITATQSNAGGASARGIRLHASSATVANNTITSSSASGANSTYQSSVYITNGATFLSGSSGNNFRTAGAACDINSGVASGTLYYTNSTGAASTTCQ